MKDALLTSPPQRLGREFEMDKADFNKVSSTASFPSCHGWSCSFGHSFSPAELIARNGLYSNFQLRSGLNGLKLEVRILEGLLSRTKNQQTEYKERSNSLQLRKKDETIPTKEDMESVLSLLKKWTQENEEYKNGGWKTAFSGALPFSPFRSFSILLIIIGSHPSQ